MNTLVFPNCAGKDNQARWKTTVDLTCDVNAGVGDPGPEDNYTRVFRPPCSYHFLWRSLYACPVCTSDDIKKVYSECVNGIRNVTYVKKIPCSSAIYERSSNETCSESTVLTQVSESKNHVNKILIGVGVVVIIALIAVAAVFFYKHRDLKYRYYSMLTRNKPMSRLAEEDEDQFLEENTYPNHPQDVRA